MNKQNVIYHYHRKDSGIKKIYGVLIHATICINLENMLYEETRHKKPHIAWFQLYKVSKIDYIYIYT